MAREKAESKGKYSDRFPGGKPLHGGGGKLNHQWEKIGQELVGTFLGMTEIASDTPGRVGHIARMREAETDTVKAFSAPDTLAGMLGGVKVGSDIAIVFSEQLPPKRKGWSGVKLFEVYEI